MTNNLMSNWIHFKIHRIYEYLSFLIQLPYHIIFHEQEYGWTVKGYIICSCEYVIDTGFSYGMHCESCYNRVVTR